MKKTAHAPWSTWMTRVQTKLCDKLFSPRDLAENPLRIWMSSVQDDAKKKYINQDTVVDGFFDAYYRLRPFCDVKLLGRMQALFVQLHKAATKNNRPNNQYLRYPRLNTIARLSDISDLFIDITIADMLAGIKDLVPTETNDKPSLPRHVQHFVALTCPWHISAYRDLFTTALLNKSHPQVISRLTMLTAIYDNDGLRDAWLMAIPVSTPTAALPTTTLPDMYTQGA